MVWRIITGLWDEMKSHFIPGEQMANARCGWEQYCCFGKR